MVRLLVLGLDGATFRVIEPLCEEERLPNLEKLMTEGVYTTLESTIPPATCPAWTALATGKNPGKTRIFDNLNRINEETFEMKLMSSADIKRAGAYWDYLSDAGLRVGVVNYPFLYPPYKINGIMVSGLGSGPEDGISYPKEFKQLLFRKCGDYRIAVPWRRPEYSKDPSLFLKHIFELLEINTKALQVLLNSNLQMLTFIISASDFAQHFMWKYIDPTHPYHRKEDAEKYRPAFVKIWRRIDEIVGSAVKALHSRSNILVVSDHGFGPRRNFFYTNSWLEQEGYLFKKEALVKVVDSLRKVQNAMIELTRKISPYLQKKLINAVGFGGMRRSNTFMSQIDMERSAALTLVNSSPCVGKIYINHHASLFKVGHVSFQAIRDEIAKKLQKTCRSLGVQLEIYFPHEIYTGPFTSLAPDILFVINDFECSFRFHFTKGSYFQTSDYFGTGEHKKEGVLIASGPDIKSNNKIESAKIYDIAPTVLHMFGLPVPDNMDGQVLSRIFRESSKIAKRSVKYQHTIEKSRIRKRIVELKKAGKL